MTLDRLRQEVEAEESEMESIAAKIDIGISWKELRMKSSVEVEEWHEALGHYVDALKALEAAELAEYEKQKLKL